MDYEDIAVLNPHDHLTFVETDLAISQDNTSLHRVATSASAKVDAVEMTAPWDGFIVSLSYKLSANKTAGTLTINPTINGSAVSFGLDAEDDTNKGYATAPANAVNGVPFKKGDLIGAAYSSDADLLPAASADIAVDMWLIYRNAKA